MYDTPDDDAKRLVLELDSLSPPFSVLLLLDPSICDGDGDNEDRVG